jgi:hypothetical protein
MKVLELFCGTKSFAKVAKARGHETFTIDIDPRFEPDMVADIGKLQVSDLPTEWQRPDVVWASPPCQCFSVMVIGKNWETKIGKDPIPKREQTIVAMALAQHTVELVKELSPTYYFIENPRAMLRKMPFMRGWPRSTVTYCQYGLEYQKATDIWNNCLEWRPRPICSPMSPCHVRAPRGSAKGIQGVGRYKTQRRDGLHPRDMASESHVAAALRAIVPPALCEEIIIACEKGAP